MEEGHWPNGSEKHSHTDGTRLSSGGRTATPVVKRFGRRRSLHCRTASPTLTRLFDHSRSSDVFLLLFVPWPSLFLDNVTM